jgi:HD-GYP domain-containing protein (c-di-GMP phosphodiesterase class II)
MDKIHSLPELEKAIESHPAYLTLEYIYTKNLASPIASDKTTIQKYNELLAMVQDLLYNKLKVDAPSSARDLPFTAMFSIAEMILIMLAKYKDVLLEVMRPEYRNDYLANHSLNVAFLACTLGTGMDLTYKELTELGVAALLHDIGMTKIDALCYTHDRNLSAEERTLLEQHPMAGWKFFEKLEHDFPWLLRVICEEHLREKGGYGNQRETAMHPYSRMVGVVDSFEALTHSRIFRKAFHPADAMKAIVEAKATLFPRNVLRAAIDVLGLFPVGSIVQLNSKKTALVVESVHRSPLRPIVRIVTEDSGEPVSMINLSKTTNVYITGIIYSDQYQIPDKLTLG